MIQLQNRIFVLQLKASCKHSKPDTDLGLNVLGCLREGTYPGLVAGLVGEGFQSTQRIGLDLGDCSYLGLDLVPSGLAIAAMFTYRHRFVAHETDSIHLGEDLVTLSATHVIKLPVDGDEELLQLLCLLLSRELSHYSGSTREHNRVREKGCWTILDLNPLADGAGITGGVKVS